MYKRVQRRTQDNTTKRKTKDEKSNKQGPKPISLCLQK